MSDQQEVEQKLSALQIEEQNNPQKTQEEFKDDGNEKSQGRQFGNNKKLVMQHRGEIETLIDQNKTEDVVLNIVKCNFDATVDDVKQAFSDFNFTKIENYNPGSFSLEFASKDDAKQFVESTRNIKILGRGFWVKFPVMHQKGNNSDNNGPKRTFINNNSNKSYNNNNEDKAEGNQQQPQQFYRGGQQQQQQQQQTDQEKKNTNYKKDYTNNYNNSYNNKRQPKVEDEWTTVGLNSKPIDLKPKKTYNNSYQPQLQQQRGGFSRNNQQKQ